MDCVFCRIIARQLPAEILYENDRVIAVLDIRPIHYGHTLVIPKTHCQDLLAVSYDDLHDVLYAAQVVARALVTSFGLRGFNLFSNNGSIAGQTVNHFHMHITPRYPEDAFRFEVQLKQYPTGAMADYAERIRRHIDLSNHS